MSRETEIATISRDNPYVMLNSEDTDETPVVTATIANTSPRETQTIYINGFNNTCVEVPVEIARKALQIQEMGKGIKCICFVDLFFNLLCLKYKCFVSLISKSLDPEIVETGSIRSVGSNCLVQFSH